MHDGIPILSKGRLLRHSVPEEVVAWRMVNGEPEMQPRILIKGGQGARGNVDICNDIFEEETEVPIEMVVDTVPRYQEGGLSGSGHHGEASRPRPKEAGPETERAYETEENQARKSASEEEEKSRKVVENIHQHGRMPHLCHRTSQSRDGHWNTKKGKRDRVKAHTR